MNEPIPYSELQNEPVRSFNELDTSLTYSYANYLNWLFEDRVELIKGKIFKMAGPARVHQEISRNISLKLGNFLVGKPCKMYVAPFDVRFPKESKADKDVFTVLQPDLCVICDRGKLDARGCIGAPDIVVEILSPGNTKMELLYKYKIYEEFGVKEYWVVSQSDQSLLIYTLDDLGKFQPSKIFSVGEKIISSVLPGFELILDDVFQD